MITVDYMLPTMYVHIKLRVSSWNEFGRTQDSGRASTKLWIARVPKVLLTWWFHKGIRRPQVTFTQTISLGSSLRDTMFAMQCRWDCLHLGHLCAKPKSTLCRWLCPTIPKYASGKSRIRWNTKIMLMFEKTKNVIFHSRNKLLALLWRKDFQKSGDEGHRWRNGLDTVEKMISSHGLSDRP